MKLSKTSFAIIGIALVAGVFMYLKVFTHRAEVNSIYLIPRDAVYILQSDKPLAAWRSVRENAMWKHLKKHPFFSDISATADHLDSLIRDNKKILELIGEKNVWISAHLTDAFHVEYLFVTDLAEKSKYLSFKSLLKNILGSNFKLTERKYKGTEILECYDKHDRSTLYISVVQNNLLFSFSPTVLEHSIDEVANPHLGRNLKFLEVFQHTEQGGLFRIYIQYERVAAFYRWLTGMKIPVDDDLLSKLVFTGLDVDEKDDDVITATGITNVNELMMPWLQALSESGKGKVEFPEVAPEKTSFFLDYHFGEFGEFYERFTSIYSQSYPGEYKKYERQLVQMQSLLDIDMQKDFIDWIGEEIAVASPVIPDAKKTGKVLAIKSKDIELAKEKMNHIMEQVRKKTPVKFKSTDFLGFPLHYLAMKGFFKIFLGGYFKRFDQPYFTYLGDYVVFSDSPNTLKYMITQYKAGRTLDQAVHYSEFRKELPSRSHLFIYTNTPLMLSYLPSSTQRTLSAKLHTGMTYWKSFSQLGISMAAEENYLSHTWALRYFPYDRIRYDEEFSIVSKKEDIWKSGGSVPPVQGMVKDPFDIRPIRPENLNADSYEEFYSNGTLRRKVGLKNGKPHGTYREYYLNGELHIKGKFDKGKKTGRWKEYDEKGKTRNIKKF